MLTKEQLDVARKCVFVSPSGDVLALLEHIDEQQAVIDELREELRKVQSDREGWARRSYEDFNRLGKALAPVRRKRSTGEPACSDGEAVEELVCDRNRLQAEIDQLQGQAEVLEEVVSSFAGQRLETEMPDDERENGDYRGAYDCMVRRARSAYRAAYPKEAEG